MVQKLNIRLLYFLAVLVFHLLFWQEQMGINVLLFAALMVIALFALNPESKTSKAAILLAGGTLLSALFVTIHNSVLSKVWYVLSFITLVGLVQQKELRFLWYGFLLGCWSFLEAPAKLVRLLPKIGRGTSPLSKTMRYLRLGFIPLAILSLFFLLYYGANPHFAQISSAFFDRLLSLFQWNISLSRLLFLGFSLFICSGILLSSRISVFREEQSGKRELLQRQRPLRHFRNGFGMIDLKNEYRSGLLLIGSLNLLLLIVNLTDICYVWFGFDEESPQNLKTYVHEGTYLLIVAILLAMAILLFLFRRNLNFYPNNKWLLRGAYLWIVQNALLAFSVGIRNFRYIDFHGLAYKRIGVILFLLLVLYGLWSMSVKIKKHKSLYFLLSRNTWALYGLLLFCSGINWDVWITRYNLTTSTKGAIDVQFMLHSVSDKNLFLLQEHLDRLPTLKTYPPISEERIHQLYEHKVKRFHERQAKQGWPSWNYSDYRNVLWSGR